MPPTTRARARWVQLPSLDAWADRYGEFPAIMRREWFRASWDTPGAVIWKMARGLDLSSSLTVYAYYRRSNARVR